MTDLAEVLELMHTARGRWWTLRASGRAWRHRDRARRAWDRWVASLRGGEDRSATYLGGGEEEPEPEEMEERWRLWLEGRERARAEFEAGGEVITVVSVGGTWWSWSPSQGVTTNQGDPHVSPGMGPGLVLVDPAPILPAVELQVAGRSSFLGRPTLEVVATPALDEDDEERFDRSWATHALGPGGNEYRLTVDAERGILLRAEARLEGSSFLLLEMEEVAFDEEPPPDTFSPPPAQEVERVEFERSVPLEELPAAVPFPVLVPERPPFGPPHAAVEPPSRRLGTPLLLRIEYEEFVGDRVRAFWVVESGEPLPEREGVRWRAAGDVRVGEDPAFRPPLRLVRLERAGTHVQIESHDLSAEELLELARSLVPFPSTPPAVD